MQKTNVKVEFRIIGDDFNPNTITEKLLIKPNEFWVRGEKIKNKNITRKYNCWVVGTGYEESNDINHQLQKISKLIKNKKNDLKKLKDIYDLIYRFDIIINIENNEKPAVYLNNDIIELANDIKAEFDFDLYIF